MKWFNVVFLAAFILLACTPSENVVQTAIPEIQETIPITISTITPLPTVSTQTPLPTITLTATPQLTSTPILLEVMDEKGGSMVLVPAGEFTMGSNSGNPDEKPPHQVFLDAFWIDKTEVTMKMYNLCVETGDCKREEDRSYYSGDLPIHGVTWDEANVYCTWAGRRLPTEAEWEKAARGKDLRIYPWGNDAPNSNLINMNPYGATIVGSYPEGASPFGALDMAGNLWEWVNDWYDDNYYSNSPLSNPEGSTSEVSKVIRGGAWDFDANDKLLRTTVRARQNPATAWNRLGFRCVRPAR